MRAPVTRSWRVSWRRWVRASGGRLRLDMVKQKSRKMVSMRMIVLVHKRATEEVMRLNGARPSHSSDWPGLRQAPGKMKPSASLLSVLLSQPDLSAIVSYFPLGLIQPGFSQASNCPASTLTDSPMTTASTMRRPFSHRIGSMVGLTSSGPGKL
jgi:hypothetical protein